MGKRLGIKFVCFFIFLLASSSCIGAEVPADAGNSEDAHSLNSEIDFTLSDPEEIYDVGLYFDLSLIKYVGYSEFEVWIAANPNGTVYDLVQDKGITVEMLESVLVDYVFEGYMKNLPDNEMWAEWRQGNDLA